MTYRKLGNTGLKVSPLCLGTMTFGDGADEATCRDIYSVSRDKGINHLDCADVYAGGQSEKILGHLVKDHRDEVVISSKAFYPTSDDINGRGLSRYHLVRAVERSLKNLNTDYIDIFYLHSFDHETPLEESLAILDILIQQGKILYLGVSNFSAWQTMKAIEASKEFRHTSIACIQPMYNLLKRQCESEILPMAQHEKLGVFSYGPLAGGYLTGKYLGTTPADSRFDKSDMYQKRYADQADKRTVELFSNFARENNYSAVSLAIAWAAAHPGITAPLIGARNVEQLKPALSALDIPMTSDLRDILSGFSRSPSVATDRAEESLPA